jgi:ribosome biogenesis GTPase A
MGQFPGKHTNVEPYWDSIKRIITESDLVLEILDARLIELSRNEEVERLIEEVGRPVIFVANKSDLGNRDDVKETTEKLKKEGKLVVFVSSKKPKSMKLLLYMIKKTFKKYGKREIPKRKKGEPKEIHRLAKADIVISVLGYPNVGKSSIINALAHKKKAQVSKKAGTTHGVHWVRLNDEIKLIDSPGVIPLGREDEIRYGLIGARDNETLKNPDIVAYAVIKYFMKRNKEAFERIYHIEITNEEQESEDAYSIVEKVAKKRNFLLKGGVSDENRACTLILRDWQAGRLRI